MWASLQTSYPRQLLLDELACSLLGVITMLAGIRDLFRRRRQERKKIAYVVDRLRVNLCFSVVSFMITMEQAGLLSVSEQHFAKKVKTTIETAANLSALLPQWQALQVEAIALKTLRNAGAHQSAGSDLDWILENGPMDGVVSQQMSDLV